MQTKIEAVRALRRIVRGHEDLVTFDAEAGWVFDEESAHFLADLEPENDARGMEHIRKTTEAHMTQHTHEHSHNGAPHPHGETHEATHVAVVSHGDTPHTRIHHETISLNDVEFVTSKGGAPNTVIDDPTHPAETAPEVVKPAKPETERQRDKRETKEKNQAARAARAAEKAAIKAKADAKLAESRAKREAEAITKEKRKADRKAKADASAAERATNAKRREESAAQRKADMVNGVYKPKPGSLLNHLWSIIDTAKESLGRMPTFDEYAARVRGLADHGTPLTQTTAYYNYRRFHGIKVRERKVYPVEVQSDASAA